MKLHEEIQNIAIEELREEIRSIAIGCESIGENFKVQGEKLTPILEAKSGSDVYADPKLLNYKELVGPAIDKFLDNIENIMKRLDDRSFGKMAKEQVDVVLKDIHNHIFSAA